MLVGLALSGCMSDSTKLLWGTQEGSSKAAVAESIDSDVRQPLDVPPSLKDQVKVPHADAIAVQSQVPERYVKKVAGKKVSLDGRVYDKPVDMVFSSVVDAMTGLNFPVQSVDSASGTITTDWIRKELNASSASVLGMIGSGGPLALRYRFVVRVLRQIPADGSAEIARLEIRTLGQTFTSRHWVNKKMKRKYADDLFNRVEELLTTK